MLPNIRNRTQMADVLGFGYRVPTPPQPPDLEKENIQQFQEQDPEVTVSSTPDRGFYNGGPFPPMAPMEPRPPWEQNNHRNLHIESQLNGLERGSRMAQDRLSMVETRLEGLFGRFESRGSQDSEIVRRLQMTYKDLEDQFQSAQRESRMSVGALQEYKVRCEREINVQREHLRGLQNEFQDFAVQAVSKTRQDMESVVKSYFTRQHLADEEWKQEIKRNNVYARDEIMRQRRVLEDMDSKMNAQKGDIRARVIALESQIMKPQEVKPDATVLRTHIDDIREQLTRMNVFQVAIAQKTEEEVTNRVENVKILNKQCHDLEQIITMLRTDVMEKIPQTRDMLEGKMRTDRQEVVGRISDVQQEFEGKFNLMHNNMNELDQKIIGRLEIFTKREAAEREALREQMSSRLNQLQTQMMQAEEVRAASLTKLYENVENFQSRQLEIVQEIRTEVHQNLQDMQFMMKSEISARMEGEQKIGKNIRDIVDHLQGLLANNLQSLQQQIDSCLKNVVESQKDSSHRAERLSRYIDDVASKFRVELVGTREALETNTGRFEERLSEYVNAQERGRKWCEDEMKRIEDGSNEKCQKLDRTFAELLEQDKRRCEQTKAFFERRLLTSEQDFSSRLQMYMEDFDNNLKSVQKALLELSKDRAQINRVVHPLTEWNESPTIYEITGGDDNSQAQNSTPSSRKESLALEMMASSPGFGLPGRDGSSPDTLPPGEGERSPLFAEQTEPFFHPVGDVTLGLDPENIFGTSLAPSEGEQDADDIFITSNFNTDPTPGDDPGSSPERNGDASSSGSRARAPFNDLPDDPENKLTARDDPGASPGSDEEEIVREDGDTFGLVPEREDGTEFEEDEEFGTGEDVGRENLTPEPIERISALDDPGASPENGGVPPGSMNAEAVDVPDEEVGDNEKHNFGDTDMDQVAHSVLEDDPVETDGPTVAEPGTDVNPAEGLQETDGPTETGVDANPVEGLQDDEQVTVPRATSNAGSSKSDAKGSKESPNEPDVNEADTLAQADGTEPAVGEETPADAVVPDSGAGNVPVGNDTDGDAPLPDPESEAGPTKDDSIDGAPVPNAEADAAPVENETADVIPTTEADAAPVENETADAIHTTEADAAPVENETADAIPTTEADAAPVENETADAIPTTEADAAPVENETADAIPSTEADAAPVEKETADAIPTTEADAAPVENETADAIPNAEANAVPTEREAAQEAPIVDAAPEPDKAKEIDPGT